jgi:nucleoside-diphosphate-sugar epimerase
MLRYFNVWGARQNPAGSYAAVVAKFTDCMRNNIPLTIFGDGLQQRDFVPVKTVVAANYAAALMPMKNWEIINVATGKSITLLMLIDELKKNFQQFNAGITFMPARNGDIYCSQADCTKLKALLKESKSPFYKNLS